MFTAEQAKGIAQLFITNLERECETTKKVLAAVPQNQLNLKIGEKGRTARELMVHIVESEIWFGEGIVSGQFTHLEAEPAGPPTVAEIVARFEKEVPALLAKVKTLSPEKLAQPQNFLNVFNLPALLYLSFWCNHTIHHRGQLSTYLRAMNARVPSIYGGSADEPFEMPATAAT